MASAVASPTSPLSHPWMSPRISFSRDNAAAEVAAVGPAPASPLSAQPSPEKDFIEFEFPLDDDPAKMLSADELFSNGKLLPLRPHRASVDGGAIRPPDAIKPRPSLAIAVESDPYVFSPKAPSCSSRWRELLGLKRSQNSPNKSDPSQQRTPSSLSKSSSHSNPNPNPTATRSLKFFIHRNTRSDSALSLPLLHRDSDADSASISARLSLSSSSSSERNDQDLPRLSLDSERIPPRVRLIRARLDAARAGRSPIRRSITTTTTTNNKTLIPPARGASVDSPRMNSSGKIVFQGLERSSSSPGSFNGGPRPVRPRNGMERSYSTNVVRVSPVLNVPVCSLRGSGKSGSVFGLGQLFSGPQKKDRDSHSGNSGTGSVRSGSGLARTGSRAVKVERVVSTVHEIRI